MRQLRRVLITGLLIALGCVILPKTVKADETISFTVSDGGQLRYDLSGDPGTGNDLEVTATVDGGSPQVLDKDTLTSGNDVADLMTALNLSGETTNHTIVITGEVLANADGSTVPGYTVTPKNVTFYYSTVTEGTSVKLAAAAPVVRTFNKDQEYNVRLTTDAKKSYLEDKGSSSNVGKTITVTRKAQDSATTADSLADVKTLVGTLDSALPAIAGGPFSRTLQMSPVTDFSGYDGIYVYGKLTQTASDTGAVAINGITYNATNHEFTVNVDTTKEGTATCELSIYVFDSAKADGYEPTSADYTDYGIYSGSFKIDTRSGAPAYIDILDEDYNPVSSITLGSGTTYTFDADTNLSEVFWIVQKKDSNLKTCSVDEYGEFTATLLDGKTSASVWLYAGDASTVAKMKTYDVVKITITKASSDLKLKVTGITRGYSLDLTSSEYVTFPTGVNPDDVTWTVTAGDADVDSDNILTVDADCTDTAIKLVPETSSKTYSALTLNVFKEVEITTCTTSKLAFTLPKSVYTYASGYDNIATVKGYIIKFLDSSDNVLGKTKMKETTSTKVSMDAQAISDMIQEVSIEYANSSKYDWEDDNQDIYFLIIPCSSGSKTNELVAAESDAYTAYEMEFVGDENTSPKKGSIYGLSGTKLNTSKLLKDGYSISSLKVDGKSSTSTATVKFADVDKVEISTTKSSSSSSSSNGSSRSSSGGAAGGAGGAGSGLDKVPKTGEGIMGFWLIAIAVIAGAIAASILLGSYFPKKKKVNSAEKDNKTSK